SLAVAQSASAVSTAPTTISRPTRTPPAPNSPRPRASSRSAAAPSAARPPRSPAPRALRVRASARDPLRAPSFLRGSYKPREGGGMLKQVLLVAALAVVLAAPAQAAQPLPVSFHTATAAGQQIAMPAGST